MIQRQQVYPIGRIGKPHGVKGEMNFMFDDDVFDRTDADHIIIETEGILVPFFFEEYRFRNDNTALIKLEGIDTQDQARELTNCIVYFERDQHPTSNTQHPLSEMTWAQIVGFKIVDSQTNRCVGTIRSVDDSTINVLFEIEDNEQRRVLIPANEELIDAVDCQQQTISMSIPDGLLAL